MFVKLRKILTFCVQYDEIYVMVMLQGAVLPLRKKKKKKIIILLPDNAYKANKCICDNDI